MPDVIEALTIRSDQPVNGVINANIERGRSWQERRNISDISTRDQIPIPSSCGRGPKLRSATRADPFLVARLDKTRGLISIWGYTLEKGRVLE
jgi:hypothetical protein